MKIVIPCTREMETPCLTHCTLRPFIGTQKLSLSYSAFFGHTDIVWLQVKISGIDFRAIAPNCVCTVVHGQCRITALVVNSN